MGAALNRGVLYDGQSGIADTAAWWNNPALFYAHEPTNLYSKTLHDAAYLGYCYGFSFDDVGNFSTGVQGDATEARITIQAMNERPVVHTVDLKPNKTLFSTTDAIQILVDVTKAIPTPFYPVFYLTLPSGGRLYLTQGNRLTRKPSAYLEKKQGNDLIPVKIAVPAPKSNVRLFSASFRNIPPGEYILQGGAVNPQAPFRNGDINWIPNAEDTEVLRVR